jgi:hypothetical protein
MYYMFAIRTLLASTIILAAMPPAVVRAASDSVEYVGGTVKTIPVNSAGSFNFDDAKEFRFTYGGAVYSLPYDQITTTQIEKADIRRVWHVFPAVSPIASRRRQTLVINYTDASGATGAVNFELAAYKAEEAQQTIAAKKSPGPGPIDAQAQTAWWGDKYWRTNRNKAEWDARDAQVAASAPQNVGQVQSGRLAPSATK